MGSRAVVFLFFQLFGDSLVFCIDNGVCEITLNLGRSGSTEFGKRRDLARSDEIFSLGLVGESFAGGRGQCTRLALLVALFDTGTEIGDVFVSKFDFGIDTCYLLLYTQSCGWVRDARP
jgi:hypothetical protein